MHKARVYRQLIVAVLLTLFMTPWAFAQDGFLDLRISKSVDKPAPRENETVEFTVTVSNVGEVAATAVVVEDKLPGTLGIPEGLAAFTSSGNYDPVTGIWVVGDLAVGQAQVMTLPAAVSLAAPPTCIVNTARLNEPEDRVDANDIALAVVRQPGVERCVDVSIELMWGPLANSICSEASSISRFFRISNQGPDEARNIVLGVTETAFKAPGLHFVDANCTGLRCTWSSLAAGASIELKAISDVFTNTEFTEHTVAAVLTTTDVDYAPDNNAGTDSGTILPFTSDCGLPDYWGGGSSSGIPISPCFIATAAYGTPYHSHIRILRQFRDETLMRYAWGRWLIDRYYRHSPPIAEYIAARPALRAMVRVVLAPLLLAIRFPFAAVMLVGVLALIGVTSVSVHRQKRIGGVQN